MIGDKRIAINNTAVFIGNLNLTPVNQQRIIAARLSHKKFIDKWHTIEKLETQPIRERCP
jgi:hypothetical protein